SACTIISLRSSSGIGLKLPRSTPAPLLIIAASRLPGFAITRVSSAALTTAVVSQDLPATRLDHVARDARTLDRHAVPHVAVREIRRVVLAIEPVRQVLPVSRARAHRALRPTRACADKDRLR